MIAHEGVPAHWSQRIPLATIDKVVRPTADDYSLVEPGLDHREEPFERVRILNAIHRCFSNIGLMTRRRISSACSCPRAGTRQ